MTVHILVEFGCNMSNKGRWICVGQISSGEKALQGESMKENQGLSERSQGKPEKESGQMS